MRSDFSFRHRFRIRYAEIDGQGVAFNSRYLEYADIMITEYWRSCGITLSGAETFEAHVAQASVQFIKPMRFDEEIDGFMRVSRFGRSSMTTSAELHGADVEDLRARIELVHVQVDLGTGLPIEIPAGVRKAFGAPGGLL